MRALLLTVSLLSLLLLGFPTTTYAQQSDAGTPDRLPTAIPVDDACVGAPDQGFVDVPPTNTFADLVDCLAAYGLTVGTGTGDEYEPQAAVRRWQMAVFLQRHLELVVPDKVPEDPPEPGFTDVGSLSEEARGAVGVLRSLDVTRGTDDDTFTPFAFVDRGQMASFIGRALGVVATAPATDADFFADDEEHTHENAINALASIGVVQGTEPGRYAPDRPVTRGQMAAFLLRSLEYAVDQGHVTAVAPWQDAADLEASCVLTPTDDQPDLPSVALRHPSGWERGNDTVGSCRYFDPEPIDIPTDTEVFGVDVRWDIDAVDFGRASQPSDDERQRLPTTVDGHQAVRVTATSDGDGLLPAGIDTTTWLVDLDIGTDGSGGTLVGQVTDTDDVDYDGAVGVLDRMARSADIDPDGDAPPATTVARMEGGGSPYAVTHEGSCFALYEGAQQGPRTAEVCDIRAGEPLSAGVLRSEERELAVGLTTTQVDVVRLRANTDAQRAVATVTVGDGARAYALELSGTEATVVAETFDGQELGSVTVLPE